MVRVHEQELVGIIGVTVIYGHPRVLSVGISKTRGYPHHCVISPWMYLVIAKIVLKTVSSVGMLIKLLA